MFPTLQNFHLFPQLPPELRLKVWSYAAHVTARIISIPYHPLHFACCLDETRTIRSCLASPAVPPLLIASREAHHAVSRYYQRLNVPCPARFCQDSRLSSDSDSQVSSMHPVHRIPIDANETILFPRPNNGMGYDGYLRDLSLFPDFERVRNVAFDFVSVTEGRREWEVYNIGVLLGRCQGVEEVRLLCSSQVEAFESSEKQDVERRPELMRRAQREFEEELAKDGLTLRQGIQIKAEVSSGTHVS